MRSFWLLLVPGCLLGVKEPVPAPAEGKTEHVLTAADLYGGFEATRVLLKDGALVLDTRNWRVGAEGVIITDVLDLGGEGVLAQPAEVSALAVSAAARTPAGTRLTTEVRTGTTFFQAAGTWTDWQPGAKTIQPKGRYAQVRIRLTTSDPKVLPAVTGLTLACDVKRPAAPAGSARLTTDKVERIVNSTVVFGYERPDQPDVAWMRRTFDLDKVIAGKEGEFEQLRALMHWAATRRNQRGVDKTGGYPWHIRTVLTEENGGTVHGHCMSYCETMITAVTSLGWYARHWAIHGFRDTSHEVPEIWVNELGKWIFMDPSLDTYYADQKTGEPLNLLEMHDIYVNFVLREGEVQQRGEDVNLERVQSLRGKHPIRCIAGGFAYGAPADWDWQWRHGYMTAGWLQLTPRNNWHSQREPWCPYFEWSPDGYCGFPLYIDEKTPIPDKDTALWYTRKRDLWWTLNQAAFRLVRSGPDTLAVECGNSQPFFKRYLARIDGGDWKEVPAQFTWTLNSGTNRLEVTCEDEFGKRGLASAATVRYRP